MIFITTIQLTQLINYCEVQLAFQFSDVPPKNGIQIFLSSLNLV